MPAALAGQRLDVVLARMFSDYSRTRLQGWLREARVRVDGVAAQPRAKVWGGEDIEIHAERDIETEALPQAIPLNIVFEDDALLVIDKPAGWVVHPGSGNRDGTLMNALLHAVPALADVPRAGIVHRLDKDTSGLLVVAKTIEAQANLVRQLQARSVKRDYLAIVCNATRAAGSVEAAIGRHPTQRTRMAVVQAGKPALTHFHRLEHAAHWSLVQCSLETGRTHQIRVHMAHVGHPLIGDPVYLPRHALRNLPPCARTFTRQALHATRLALRHPSSGEECAWHSPTPADMSALLTCLRHHERPAH
ncbi:MAG TPA: 23S rRNA pseudouridine(1911/1915/1917) synthase RluD [Burkholderiales bacterium]|nr:23S rRNA pseudouridine(1911/1915/1917) synthase RluD [Burkholderiales bacterium]